MHIIEVDTLGSENGKLFSYESTLSMPFFFSPWKMQNFMSAVTSPKLHALLLEALAKALKIRSNFFFFSLYLLAFKDGQRL